MNSRRRSGSVAKRTSGGGGPSRPARATVSLTRSKGQSPGHFFFRPLSLCGFSLALPVASGIGLFRKGSLISLPPPAARRNALIDMDAPEPQQPMQTGWMSYNPYQAQQQAQMEEYMRQQQLLELQRQVRLAAQ